MPSFVDTVQPTPFGIYDADPDFQKDADSMVIFVKRHMGDDVLSVELTRKEIWSCFEQAALTYSRLIHEMRIKNELVNVLGLPADSFDLTEVYPRRTLNYLNRMAEPYSEAIGVGGSRPVQEGMIKLHWGQQKYNLYHDMEFFSGPLSGTTISSGSQYLPSGTLGKITVIEVMHFEPIAAQTMLLNASNITNFLATNFNYESYVNSSVFYVLPVFEDVLRRSMLETAFRVRRSNFSYRLSGPDLFLYPVPVSNMLVDKNLFIRFYYGEANPVSSGSLTTGTIGSGSIWDPNDPGYEDGSTGGITSPADIPFNAIPYEKINEPGRQWIREYTLALASEILGLIRSKYDRIPVPNAEVTLNGNDLINRAREDKQRLLDNLRDFLLELTHDKITEREAIIAENINKQLKYVPMPQAIQIG